MCIPRSPGNSGCLCQTPRNTQFNIDGNAPLEPTWNPQLMDPHQSFILNSYSPSHISLLSEEDGSAKKGISYEETFGELMFEENEQLGVLFGLWCQVINRISRLINHVVSSGFWDMLNMLGHVGTEAATFFCWAKTMPEIARGIARALKSGLLPMHTGAQRWSSRPKTS